MSTATDNDITLDNIEDLTRKFARERTQLADKLGDLEAELLAAKRRRLRGIRNQLARTQDAKAELENAITANAHLFLRPRTVTIDGVRVGITKSKGKVAWDDEAKVVRLIERHLPEAADALIKTTRKPIRAALASLTAAELKKIGCRVEETSDQVLIKTQDSELDKWVGRLLEETSDIEEVS